MGGLYLQDLNYNVMFSQRGVLNLGHTLQDMRDIHRRVNANRLNGIDSEALDTKQVQEIVPHMDCSANTRYPVFNLAVLRVLHVTMLLGAIRGYLTAWTFFSRQK